MNRPTLVQSVIDGHIDRIRQQFWNNPNNSNWEVIQGQDAQKLFDELTKNYDKLLPLISFMKSNNTKPLLMEIEVCLQEIYLEFIKRSCPLDTNLATQILNKILS